MNNILAISVACILISACSSIGTQYKQPAANEEHAEILPSKFMYLVNFNEKGCYIGRTLIDDGIVRVYPDRDTVFSFEMGTDDYYCRVPFSFKPEKSAKYKFSIGVVDKTKSKVDLSNVNQIKCSTQVFKIGEGGIETPVSIKPLKLKTRFACIQFVPRDE